MDLALTELEQALSSHKGIHSLNCVFVDLAYPCFCELEHHPYLSQGQVFVVIKCKYLLTTLWQALNGCTQYVLQDQLVRGHGRNIVTQVWNDVISQKDVGLNFTLQLMETAAYQQKEDED